MGLLRKIIPDTFTHCRYCQLPFDSERLRTRDHFVPLSKDGKHVDKNVVIVCQYCNNLKGNFLPCEFIYYLRCKIKWKEYPGIGGFTFNEGTLQTIKHNVSEIYNAGDSGNRLGDHNPNKSQNPAQPKKKADQINGLHYLNYLGKDCPCIGFVDRPIGYGIKQYQNVFYHAAEEVYLFVVDGTVYPYNKKTIEKFIKPFFPNDQTKQKGYYEKHAADVALSVNSNTPKVYPKRLEDFKEVLKSEPEPNFHYI